jgi:uridine phosphorylase
MKDYHKVFNVEEQKDEAVIFGLGSRSCFPSVDDTGIKMVGIGCAGSNAIEMAYLPYQSTPVSVGVGFFGSLQEEIKKGDIVIPTESTDGGTVGEFDKRASNESWLRQREQYRFKPDADLSKILEDEFIDAGYNVYKGKILSVSGVEMEPNDVIEMLHDKGYVGVEMETATLFSRAEHYRNKTAAVIAATDNQWPVEKRSNFNKEIADKMFVPLVSKTAKVLKERVYGRKADCYRGGD